MTTRIAGSPAISSNVSTRRQAISGSMALCACGRFNVISAIAPLRSQTTAPAPDIGFSFSIACKTANLRLSHHALVSGPNLGPQRFLVDLADRCHRQGFDEFDVLGRL